MKQLFLLLVLGTLLTSCKNDPQNSEEVQNAEDSTSVSSEEREFKVLDSEYITADSLWVPFEKDLDEFTSEVYEEVKALVFEKSIPEIQESIAAGKLTYEELSLFYLTRIREYDRENELSLNSVISLNPDLITEARKKMSN